MTTITSTRSAQQESRAGRLKTLTHQTHDRLDSSIMAAASFASLDGYGRFLAVQSMFHRDIDALYDSPALRILLPGLEDRRRRGLIEADLADLGIAHPPHDLPAVFLPDETIDIPTALGWLYVAEGSNMGAALLRKEVAKIGLSDSHGARHLAPAPEGPAAHWRAFTAALDAAELTTEEDLRVVSGANAAFMRVQTLVDTHIG